MDIRLRAEELERRIMSPYACLSSASKGRERPEDECNVRTCFQRDRDRILHSKSFRRLKYKTQVFTIPEGDHYRTRLTHTLEVAQIARTVARALRLNEDLTEAIALGHDLGHTPFGHAGEDALNEVMEGGFKHNQQSLRVVDVLEGGGGLNLTYEVRDGILNHTGDTRPATLEGQIVKIADRVAYINHDIDDAIRGGILTMGNIPEECLAVLGREHRNRINTMVLDLVQTNWEEPSVIRMSPAIQSATDQLRDFLFAHVYIGSDAKREEAKAKHVVQRLFCHFSEHGEALPEEYLLRVRNANTERVICDYIAGMTDRFAIRYYQRTFLPLPWVE
ncbi:Deoxyguanosinetriphosphate triphosphohydrolase [Pelotomaculum sp. FP]|uniref:deoxyguanosinetriphosphate triphosphohydrolase n=1 Tax=Pelotomaculum sp. FP TaxID=261474 RepID=UPI0010663BC6|nr:deoxyguanosinetriphosphate triphosphohydrolase [Pelotomaculum sp. FP]TEB15392.1 Deoxyguanosinetriphosphate triphosphohydrolase [Pelotomaculum sp. FP]